MDESRISDLMIERQTETIIQNSNKSWFLRMFAPESRQAFRGGILITLSTSILTGIFAYHRVFSNFGFFWAAAFLLFISWCYYLSTNILIMCFLHKKQVASLFDLVKQTVGERICTFYQLIFMIYCVFSMATMVLIMNKNAYILYEDYFPISGKPVDFEVFNYYSSIVSGLLVFLMIRMRSIDFLRFYSFLSIFIIAWMVFVSILETPSYFEHLTNQERDFNYTSIKKGTFISTLGLIMFSMNPLTNAFTIINVEKRASMQYVQRKFKYLFVYLWVFFLSFGLCSYLSLGINAENLDYFIYREKIGTDFLMSLGMAIMICALLICIGINTFPLKSLIIEKFFRSDMTEVKNVLFSLTFSVLITSMAAFFTDILHFLSFCGIFCVGMLAFVIPSLMGLAIDYYQGLFGKLYLLIHMLTFLVLSLMGGVYAMINLFQQ